MSFQPSALLALLAQLNFSEKRSEAYLTGVKFLTC